MSVSNISTLLPPAVYGVTGGASTYYPYNIECNSIYAYGNIEVKGALTDSFHAALYGPTGGQSITGVTGYTPATTLTWDNVGTTGNTFPSEYLNNAGGSFTLGGTGASFQSVTINNTGMYDININIGYAYGATAYCGVTGPSLDVSIGVTPLGSTFVNYTRKIVPVAVYPSAATWPVYSGNFLVSPAVISKKLYLTAGSAVIITVINNATSGAQNITLNNFDNVSVVGCSLSMAKL